MINVTSAKFPCRMTTGYTKSFACDQMLSINNVSSSSALLWFFSAEETFTTSVKFFQQLICMEFKKLFSRSLMECLNDIWRLVQKSSTDFFAYSFIIISFLSFQHALQILVMHVVSSSTIKIKLLNKATSLDFYVGFYFMWNTSIFKPALCHDRICYPSALLCNAMKLLLW